jgi:acyl-homoserine-lactone acylase
MTLGGTMRTRPGRAVVAAVALFAAIGTLPAAAAQDQWKQEHPSHGGLTATIRYT